MQIGLLVFRENLGGLMAFCHRAYGILSQGLWHSVTLDYLTNRHKTRLH